MSMVFDGAIVAASSGIVEQALREIHTHLDLTFGAVVNGVFAVYPKGGRRQFDAEEDKRIAASLSKLLGKALVALWDDRIDCDQAYLFDNGHIARQFGRADERYVLLDENGEPDKEGQRFRLEELSRRKNTNASAMPFMPAWKRSASASMSRSENRWKHSTTSTNSPPSIVGRRLRPNKEWTHLGL